MSWDTRRQRETVLENSKIKMPLCLSDCLVFDICPQLTLYAQKFDEFQGTLAKSNEIYVRFKQEMDNVGVERCSTVYEGLLVWMGPVRLYINTCVCVLFHYPSLLLLLFLVWHFSNSFPCRCQPRWRKWTKSRTCGRRGLRTATRLWLTWWKR